MSQLEQQIGVTKRERPGHILTPVSSRAALDQGPYWCYSVINGRDTLVSMISEFSPCLHIWRSAQFLCGRYPSVEVAWGYRLNFCRYRSWRIIPDSFGFQHLLQFRQFLHRDHQRRGKGRGSRIRHFVLLTTLCHCVRRYLQCFHQRTFHQRNSYYIVWRVTNRANGCSRLSNFHFRLCSKFLAPSFSVQNDHMHRFPSLYFLTSRSASVGIICFSPSSLLSICKGSA